MIDPAAQPVQADLGIDEVRRLIADLAAHAEAVEVLVKGAAGRPARAEDRPPALGDVPSIVESRCARGIQIRYRFDGFDWTDTLMIVPSGARLVRMRHG